MRRRPALVCRIVGICGSLRAGSYNRGLLAAAQRMAPPLVEVDVVDVGGLPPYNADLQADGRDPLTVSWLKQILDRADGVLIATPEYNRSVPGVLKNAIDWLSCPVATSALRDKPVAVMGATVGPFGTTQAQADLRRILQAAGAVVLDGPEVLVSLAPAHFDREGTVTDQPTLHQVAELVEALVAQATRRPALVSVEGCAADGRCQPCATETGVARPGSNDQRRQVKTNGMRSLPRIPGDELLACDGR